jgi:hypothetical protein
VRVLYRLGAIQWVNQFRPFGSLFIQQRSIS